MPDAPLISTPEIPAKAKDITCEPYDVYHFNDIRAQEPKVCKKFGCGKKLSLQEDLFGPYCQDHQQQSAPFYDLTKHLSL